jgi:hypothetical protein
VGDVGERIVRIIKEPAARQLLEDLERADDLEGASIRALLAAVLREDTERAWLEQLLRDCGGEDGEADRLRLIDELRREIART